MCTLAHIIITAFLSGNRDHGPVLFIVNTNFSVLDGLDVTLSVLFACASITHLQPRNTKAMAATASIVSISSSTCLLASTS